MQDINSDDIGSSATTIPPAYIDDMQPMCNANVDSSTYDIANENATNRQGCRDSAIPTPREGQEFAAFHDRECLHALEPVFHSAVATTLRHVTREQPQIELSTVAQRKSKVRCGRGKKRNAAKTGEQQKRLRSSLLTHSHHHGEKVVCDGEREQLRKKNSLQKPRSTSLVAASRDQSSGVREVMVASTNDINALGQTRKQNRFVLMLDEGCVRLTPPIEESLGSNHTPRNDGVVNIARPCLERNDGSVSVIDEERLPRMDRLMVEPVTKHVGTIVATEQVQVESTLTGFGDCNETNVGGVLVPRTENNESDKNGESSEVREYAKKDGVVRKKDGKDCGIQKTEAALQQQYDELKRRYRHVLRLVLGFGKSSAPATCVETSRRARVDDEFEVSYKDLRNGSKLPLHDGVYICKVADALSALGIENDGDSFVRAASRGNARSSHEQCLVDGLQFIEHVMKMVDIESEGLQCIRDVVDGALVRLLEEVSTKTKTNTRKVCRALIGVVTNTLKRWFEEVLNGNLAIGWGVVLTRDVCARLNAAFCRGRHNESGKEGCVVFADALHECIRETMRGIGLYYVGCESGEIKSCMVKFGRSVELSVCFVIYMEESVRKMEEEELMVLARHNSLLLHTVSRFAVEKRERKENAIAEIPQYPVEKAGANTINN